MQPLPPRLRTALKSAHPGLTDRDLDRFEELRGLPSRLHPLRHATELAQVRQETVEFIREHMPRLAAVIEREQLQAIRNAPPRRKRKVTVRED